MRISPSAKIFGCNAQVQIVLNLPLMWYNKGVKKVVLGIAVALMVGAVVSSPVKAQDPDFVMDISEKPICFVVKNEAAYSVTGSIVSNFYMTPEGYKARHRSNFRLGAMGSTDEREGYPLDVAEFCTSGPFYPGRKVEFVIRTLVPVFSCITNIQSGPIIIKGKRRADDMGNETWAECYE